jgi:acyl-coenzyme A synthetase/AMP-(fatty) acid ligase
MYAGIVPVLVDRRLLEAGGKMLLARARARAVWTDTKLDAAWANGVLQIDGSFPPQPVDSLRAAEVGDDDLAALMPTSGSTGTPQLVMVTHGNLRANTEAIIRSQNLESDDRAMLVMPISYCFGASVLHSHLYQGGSVVFDSRFMFPDRVLRAIDSYECTTFAGVPAVYNILLRRSNVRTLPLTRLRRFLEAGGALPAANIHELCDALPKVEFFAMYGQTEATARIACLSVTRTPEKLGSVGRLLDNVRARIIDESGRELSCGETGEIEVQGQSVCAGYFCDEESTDRKFRDGWLKTGDFGCFDDDGYLWIKGRADDFIKIRGFRIGSVEIEERVSAVAGVCECAAVGVTHPEAGEAVALFVVPDEADTYQGDLIAKVRLALPPHWTCAAINLVSSLPKTNNGKVARSQLRIS